MTMCSPTNLGAPANNVRKNVGGRPWIGVMYQAIDLVIGSIVDSQSLLDELFADIGG